MPGKRNEKSVKRASWSSEPRFAYRAEMQTVSQTGKKLPALPGASGNIMNSREKTVAAASFPGTGDTGLLHHTCETPYPGPVTGFHQMREPGFTLVVKAESGCRNPAGHPPRGLRHPFRWRPIPIRHTSRRRRCGARGPHEGVCLDRSGAAREASAGTRPSRGRGPRARPAAKTGIRHTARPLGQDRSGWLGLPCLESTPQSDRRWAHYEPAPRRATGLAARDP